MKKIIYIFTRSALLLFLSYLLTTWFFSYFQQATLHITLFEKGVSYSTQPAPVKEVLEDISPIAKIPLPLMKFDAYASNNMIDLNNGSATSTNLNIGILDEYKEISTGNTKELYKNVYIQGLTIQRSIKTFGENKEALNKNLDGNFKIFFKPTSRTFALVWIIFMIPLIYGLIAVFSSCLKFILTGHPFTDKNN